ncbi:MAG: hypothetical protein JWP49_2208 [Phenylobacterium sp.]|jgi:hypothetical protein|nr:hypothetical protein [Phenylobacterium sp.]
MRRVAILAIVLGCGGSTAAFAAGTPAGPRASADPLTQAAFASNAPTPASDPIGQLLDRASYAPNAGVVGRTSSEAPLFAHPGGAIDSLRIREESLFGAPGELPLTRRAGVDPKSYEISLMRAWPGALSFDAGRLAVDVSPHAGIGVIGGDQADGTSAEAGAMLQVSKADLAAKRLNAMGVKDGAQFGDQGRWYLFAAASGRAVGMNMLHGDAGWGRAGWSTDPTSKLVGDAQLGVGWRKGAIQTSVGYVHRKVKGDHLMYGVDPHDDSMVAFSLSIRPRK